MRRILALMAEPPPLRCGLDVFEDEPAMKPGLAQCPNAVIVPHIASASMWTRSGMVSVLILCTSFFYHAWMACPVGFMFLSF